MKLEDLGYTGQLEKYRIDHHLDLANLGRVVSEHKERYVVKTEKGDSEAEITGNLRYSAKSREDFPAVGDWVAITTYDSGMSVIHSILPRFSAISRQAVGQPGEKQLIATNIDEAFLVQAVDRDFNINRLERYLTICYSSNIKPVVVLTKADLIDSEKAADLIARIRQRVSDVEVIAVSTETPNGCDELKSLIVKGKTYCMLGSSGVGKSTLINHLSERDLMKTDAISTSTHKGRHTTSHRELFVMENGAMIVDNPGMREIGIGDAASGIASTFDSISTISADCRFKNCTHTSEAGCAVLRAVADGTLDRSSYENYLKIEKEKAHFEASTFDRRKKDKDFGKMLKNFKKGGDKRPFLP